jgi:DNA polymerase III delta subunit
MELQVQTTFQEMGVSVRERASELGVSIPLTARDQLHYRVDGQSLVISTVVGMMKYGRFR